LNSDSFKEQDKQLAKVSNDDYELLRDVDITSNS